MRKATLELLGQISSRLLVLEKFSKPRYWVCKSDCGNIIKTLGSRLVDGTTSSCGCVRVKHGHAAKGQPSPTYWSWKSMKARCNSSKVSSHGGRGIRYDPRWESFENFLADMGTRPEGKTLDRTNVMSHYSKWNCRWANAIVQANNKRSSEILYYNFEHDGSGGTAAEWARCLRSGTGNSAWTVRQLQCMLKTLSLDQIMGAVHPQRLSPEELNEKVREFRKTEEERRVDKIFSDLIADTF